MSEQETEAKAARTLLRASLTGGRKRAATQLRDESGAGTTFPVSQKSWGSTVPRYHMSTFTVSERIVLLSRLLSLLCWPAHPPAFCPPDPRQLPFRRFYSSVYSRTPKIQKYGVCSLFRLAFCPTAYVSGCRRASVASQFASALSFFLS